MRSLIDDGKDGSNAKLDELFTHMHSHNIHMAMLAETWRLDSADLIGGGEGRFLMLQHGLQARDCNRGRLGVALVLGEDMQAAGEKCLGHRLPSCGPLAINGNLRATSTRYPWYGPPGTDTLVWPTNVRYQPH